MENKVYRWILKIAASISELLLLLGFSFIWIKMETAIALFSTGAVLNAFCLIGIADLITKDKKDEEK